MNQSRRKSSTDLLTMPKIMLSRRSQSPSKMLHITELWTSLSKSELDYNSIEDDNGVDQTDSHVYQVNKYNLSSTNLMDYENRLIIQSNFSSSLSNASNKNLTPKIPHRNRQRRSSFSLLFPTKSYSEMDTKDIREELVREMCLKLKDFTNSALPNLTSNIMTLPENNLQVCGNKEIYQQQSAIRELMETELNFLKQIRFIVQIYVGGFEILRPKYFPKVMSEEIFSNLKEVSRVSSEFWKHCIYPVIENYETTKQMYKPRLLKNGFIKIGEILEPYILYCTEISKCRSSISSLEKSNELFAEYIKWAMNFEESNREMLSDHLAKPFLRLTKYKILLQAIHKYSEIDEKKEIQEMIDAVDAFVSHVNEKIEEANIMKKLQNLNSFIDTYDVIEPLGDDLIPIINQYSKLDLTTPIHHGSEKVIREILFQGSLKLREGPSKTIDVKLFLLTDILLITKFKKKHIGKLKVIKPPIILDSIKIHKFNTNSFICVCLNDFNCISALYHFSNGDQKKIDEWTERLQAAGQKYSKQKSKFLNSLFCKELHESIPMLKVDRSSPKVSRIRPKSQSNSESIDNDLQNEYSFKRKAPVTKKHKNRREISISKPKPFSAVPQRKNSNPISKPNIFYSDTNKLYKSNSFADNVEKSKIKRNLSDCSDIDEPFEGSHDFCSYKNVSVSEKSDKIENLQSVNPRSVDLKITDCRKLSSRKNMTSNFVNNLEKKLSTSLSTLGT